jgi:hypothetical protein
MSSGAGSLSRAAGRPPRAGRDGRGTDALRALAPRLSDEPLDRLTRSAGCASPTGTPPSPSGRSRLAPPRSPIRNRTKGPGRDPGALLRGVALVASQPVMAARGRCVALVRGRSRSHDGSEAGRPPSTSAGRVRDPVSGEAIGRSRCMPALTRRRRRGHAGMPPSLRGLPGAPGISGTGAAAPAPKPRPGRPRGPERAGSRPEPW